MSKKRAVTVGLAIIFGLLLASCGRDDRVVIRVGDIWSPTHPVTQAMIEVFKPQVEERSEGAISVEIFHSGMLGNEQTLWDSVRSGVLEMAVVGSVMNSEWTPMLISDWPFLYRDIFHAKNVWTGSFAADFEQDFNTVFPTVQMLAVGPNSARALTSSRPLTSIADVNGQRFRVPANPIHTGIITDLGASAQVVPLHDLFSALQTGVVDGQDNGMVTVLSENFHEVQDYLLETNHIIATMNLVVSSSFFNRLTPEHQEIIRDAARDTAVWAWDRYIESIDQNRETLRNNGVTVTALSDADRAFVLNAIQPTLNRLYAEHQWARDLTDKARNVQ